MSLKDALRTAHAGGAILFCGSGFSADCLNFSDNELGTAAPLLAAFNYKYPVPFTDLRLASQRYIKDKGDVGLASLIQQKYRAKHITTDVNLILQFPWRTIYTVNYDNVIESALTANKIAFKPISHTDPITALVQNVTNVVHLHGRSENVTSENVRQEIILTLDQYLGERIYEGPWGAKFRNDLAGATAAIFIGYALKDPHIQKLIFHVPQNKEVHFINDTQFDAELEFEQSTFGKAHFIGRRDFAKLTASAIKHRDETPRLHTVCFSHQKISESAHAVRENSEISDLFFKGKISEEILDYEIINGSAEYRVRRAETDEIVRLARSAGSVTIVTGGLGRGKTLCLLEAAKILASENRDVFILRRHLDSLENEFHQIIKFFPAPTFVIEDVYRLGATLNRILRSAPDSVRFLFSARTRINEARLPDILSEVPNFAVEKVEVGNLDDVEIVQLVKIVDRIGRWGHNSGQSSTWKINNIKKQYKSNFADFLIGLIESEDIVGRLRQSINILKENDEIYLSIIVLILYLDYIGLQPDIDLIDEIYKIDVLNRIKKEDAGEVEDAFNFIELNDKDISFRSSIIAQYVLEKVIADNEILESLGRAMEGIAPVWNSTGDLYYAFTQLMRFTFLRGVVADLDAVSKFYTRLSNFPACREHPLFWLQFAMVELERADYPSARSYLNSAYGQAAKRPNYNTYQIDNQYARLLLLTPREPKSPQSTFEAWSKAHSIIFSQAKQEQGSEYPYRRAAELYGRFVNEHWTELTVAEQAYVERDVREFATFVRNLTPKIRERREVRDCLNVLNTILLNKTGQT